VGAGVARIAAAAVAAVAATGLVATAVSAAFVSHVLPPHVVYTGRRFMGRERVGGGVRRRSWRLSIFYASWRVRRAAREAWLRGPHRRRARGGGGGRAIGDGRRLRVHGTTSLCVRRCGSMEGQGERRACSGWGPRVSATDHSDAAARLPAASGLCASECVGVLYRIYIVSREVGVAYIVSRVCGASRRPRVHRVRTLSVQHVALPGS
jgi:hypothetical protein